MAKQLNPMPSSAKAARRTIWVQVLVLLGLAGWVWFGHENRHDWIPPLIADDIYRTAVGMAAAAIGLLILSALMRYQWRLVWILILLVQVAWLAGDVWIGVDGISWWIVAVLAIPPVIVVFALLGRVTRRWFHHWS